MASSFDPHYWCPYKDVKLHLTDHASSLLSASRSPKTLFLDGQANHSGSVKRREAEGKAFRKEINTRRHDHTRQFPS